jgi:hypothetical protein
MTDSDDGPEVVVEPLSNGTVMRSEDGAYIYGPDDVFVDAEKLR